MIALLLKPELNTAKGRLRGWVKEIPGIKYLVAIEEVGRAVKLLVPDLLTELMTAPDVRPYSAV